MLSYTVDAERAEIILRTTYYKQERTDVIFSGVEAYDFECANFQNIIFDIEEVEPISLYDKHRERFERLKNHVWPFLQYKSRDELVQVLDERGVRGFEINSSYGIEGWVWARSIELRAA